MGTTSTTMTSCKFNSVSFETGNPAYTTRCDALISKSPPPGTNVDQGATCPDYMATCSTNFSTTIENKFAPTSPNNLVIDDHHFRDLYLLANDIADNRNFLDPAAMPSNITAGNIVNHNDYNGLKLWADSIAGANLNVTYRSRGNLIDNASLLTLKAKYKEIAVLCNTNGHCACDSICTCNTVCTCNCVTNY